MREIRSKAGMPIWREDNRKNVSLVITRAGRDAIGVGDDMTASDRSPPKAVRASAISKTPPAKTSAQSELRSTKNTRICSIEPLSRNAHDIFHFALRKYPTVKLTLVILPTLTGAMNRNPRYALSRELKAKQTLLDQLRAPRRGRPRFLHQRHAVIAAIATQSSPGPARYVLFLMRGQKSPYGFSLCDIRLGDMSCLDRISARAKSVCRHPAADRGRPPPRGQSIQRADAEPAAAAE
jgi:hypothetical protein